LSSAATATSYTGTIVLQNARLRNAPAVVVVSVVGLLRVINLAVVEVVKTVVKTAAKQRTLYT